MAAPIPVPPTAPMTAPTAVAGPLPRKLFPLVAAPIRAPTPAPTPPKINAFRSRWLLFSKVTRATFSFLMPTSLEPSRSWIASSLTVERVPACFFRLVSTTSIF